MASSGLFWSSDAKDKKNAKSICSSCPVKEPCLEEALRLRETGVIRGGKEL